MEAQERAQSVLILTLSLFGIVRPGGVVKHCRIPDLCLWPEGLPEEFCLWSWCSTEFDLLRFPFSPWSRSDLSVRGMLCPLTSSPCRAAPSPPRNVV